MLSKIEVGQVSGALNLLFKNNILPTLTSADELLSYSAFMKRWSVGKELFKDEFCTYGTDEKGYPKVYMVTVTHVAQDNIKPSDSVASQYQLIGYIDGIRIWTQPFSEHDSYALDEVVPKMYMNPHELVEYVLGNTLYRGDVFLYENVYYIVNVNQIVASNYVIPSDPKQTQYTAIDGYVSGDKFNEVSYKYFKSKKDDNRFEPTEGSQVWELLN